MTYERLAGSTPLDDHYRLFPPEPFPERLTEPRTPRIVELVAGAGAELAETAAPGEN